MDNNVLVEVIEGCENKSNAELLAALEILKSEFEHTKKMLFDLSNHLDTVESKYNKIHDELEKRMGK